MIQVLTHIYLIYIYLHIYLYHDSSFKVKIVVLYSLWLLGPSPFQTQYRRTGPGRTKYIKGLDLEEPRTWRDCVLKMKDQGHEGTEPEWTIYMKGPGLEKPGTWTDCALKDQEQKRPGPARLFGQDVVNADVVQIWKTSTFGVSLNIVKIVLIAV